MRELLFEASNDVLADYGQEFEGTVTRVSQVVLISDLFVDSGHLLSATTGGDEHVLVLRVIIQDEITGRGIVVPA